MTRIPPDARAATPQSAQAANEATHGQHTHSEPPPPALLPRPRYYPHADRGLERFQLGALRIWTDLDTLCDAITPDLQSQRQGFRLLRATILHLQNMVNQCIDHCRAATTESDLLAAVTPLDQPSHDKLGSLATKDYQRLYGAVFHRMRQYTVHQETTPTTDEARRVQAQEKEFLQHVHRMFELKNNLSNLLHSITQPAIGSLPPLVKGKPRKPSAPRGEFKQPPPLPPIGARDPKTASTKETGLLPELPAAAKKVMWPSEGKDATIHQLPRTPPILYQSYCDEPHDPATQWIAPFAPVFKTLYAATENVRSGANLTHDAWKRVDQSLEQGRLLVLAVERALQAMQQDPKTHPRKALRTSARSYEKLLSEMVTAIDEFARAHVQNLGMAPENAAIKQHFVAGTTKIIDFFEERRLMCVALGKRTKSK